MGGAEEEAAVFCGMTGPHLVTDQKAAECAAPDGTWHIGPGGDLC